VLVVRTGRRFDPRTTSHSFLIAQRRISKAIIGISPPYLRHRNAPLEVLLPSDALRVSLSRRSERIAARVAELRCCYSGPITARRATKKPPASLRAALFKTEGS